MSLSSSNAAKRRIVIALASQPSANNLIGAVGVYGTFVVSHSAAVLSSTSDISATPISGEPGAFTVYIPGINSLIQSIDWLDVTGFTPRTATTAETDAARITGYGYNSTLNQWYITIQIALLSTNAIDATPPANFTVNVRAAVTLLPQANHL
jgi:hypothetical protein